MSQVSYKKELKLYRVSKIIVCTLNKAETIFDYPEDEELDDEPELLLLEDESLSESDEPEDELELEDESLSESLELPLSDFVGLFFRFFTGGSSIFFWLSFSGF